jgi:hypothetical protein
MISATVPKILFPSLVTSNERYGVISGKRRRQPTQKCNKAMPPVACAPFFDAPGQWIKKRRMNSARLDDVALNSGEYSSLPLHSARASAPPAPLPAC